MYVHSFFLWKLISRIFVVANSSLCALLFEFRILLREKEKKIYFTPFFTKKKRKNPSFYETKLALHSFARCGFRWNSLYLLFAYSRYIGSSTFFFWIGERKMILRDIHIILSCKTSLMDKQMLMKACEKKLLKKCKFFLKEQMFNESWVRF